jgi:hypothetical protein
MKNRGFGIDENTALIYIGSKNLVKVAGTSGITMINARYTRISYVQKMPDIENLSVSYLEEGDSYDATTGIITSAEEKKPTCGNEYYNVKNPGQAGILSGNSTTFHDLITINLIDNKGADTVHNLSFSGQNSGFLVNLYKTPSSTGFYTDKPNDEDRYTVTNIMMDVIPVQISITPLKKILQTK